MPVTLLQGHESQPDRRARGRPLSAVDPFT